jgi:hypothetical protein
MRLAWLLQEAPLLSAHILKLLAVSLPARVVDSINKLSPLISTIHSEAKSRWYCSGELIQILEPFDAF